MLFRSTINVNASTNQEINGGAGNDIINMNSNNNTNVQAGSGNDNIKIIGSNNTVNGNDGNNTIIATGNNNNITAENGDNRLSSIGNLNTITSGSGNNTLGVDGENNSITSNGHRHRRLHRPATGRGADGQERESQTGRIVATDACGTGTAKPVSGERNCQRSRSEEHTSELQSHA